jgi:hypothetical protein
MKKGCWREITGCYETAKVGGLIGMWKTFLKKNGIWCHKSTPSRH